MKKKSIFIANLLISMFSVCAAEVCQRNQLSAQIAGSNDHFLVNFLEIAKKI